MAAAVAVANANNETKKRFINPLFIKDDQDPIHQCQAEKAAVLETMHIYHDKLRTDPALFTAQ